MPESNNRIEYWFGAYNKSGKKTICIIYYFHVISDCWTESDGKTSRIEPMLVKKKLSFCTYYFDMEIVRFWYDYYINITLNHQFFILKSHQIVRSFDTNERLDELNDENLVSVSFSICPAVVIHAHIFRPLSTVI